MRDRSQDQVSLTFVCFNFRSNLAFSVYLAQAAAPRTPGAATTISRPPTVSHPRPPLIPHATLQPDVDIYADNGDDSGAQLENDGDDPSGLGFESDNQYDEEDGFESGPNSIRAYDRKGKQRQSEIDNEDDAYDEEEEENYNELMKDEVAYAWQSVYEVSNRNIQLSTLSSVYFRLPPGRKSVRLTLHITPHNAVTVAALELESHISISTAYTRAVALLVPSRNTRRQRLFGVPQMLPRPRLSTRYVLN